MSDNNPALVSIIIPAYNAEPYLAETIQSCLDQTHPAVEIIVIDDGSSDGTRRVAENFPAVRYFHQTNAGPAAARNHGIRQAHGEFLQFLDADDILLPDKISHSLQVFQAYPDCGLVYCNYEFRSQDLSHRLDDATKTVKVLPQSEMLNYLIRTGTTLFGIHCALIRAEAVHAVGGFDEGIIITEDWHFWVKLAAQGVIFRHLDETLVWYRTAPGSLSQQDIRLSRMRLKAYQHLRGIPLPPHLDLEKRIAGRHHALAMDLWRSGQRGEARQHFQLAIATHPDSRLIRYLLWLMTYCLPAEIAETILNRLLKLRSQRNRR
jgi:glycosyltransferase involved in cell wall biosynthesis